MRRLPSIFLLAFALALAVPAAPANAQENCFFILSWSAQGTTCGTNKRNLSLIGIQVRECRTGDGRLFDTGPPTGCRIAYNNAAGYVERSGQCVPIGTILAPELVNG